MKALRRYTRFGDLINEAIDDMAFGWDYFSPLGTNFSFRGRLVDEDKFDIIPKQSYIDSEIKRKQEAIEENERQHDSSNKYYEQRKKQLEEERERLIRQKNKDGWD